MFSRSPGLAWFGRESGFSDTDAPSGTGMRGALAVEYAFCMLIIAVMMAGVQELFWEMSGDILGNFVEWISQTYP